MKQYYLHNAKKGLYFTGFEGNKPLWAKSIMKAALYDLEMALNHKRRLNNLYMPAQEIKIMKK